MKKIVLVYDDTVKVNDRIKTIIGDKSFGEMILKRKTLYSRIEDIVNESKLDINFLKINIVDEFKNISLYSRDTIFFHLLSSAAVIDFEGLSVIVEKLKYIDETTILEGNGVRFGVIFKDRDSYESFMEDYLNQKDLSFVKGSTISDDSLVDLTDYNNLLMYISSGFDARYFNSLQGDSYTVTKRSQDKKKMKMEYTYYWLLPEPMKSWMVMPYGYQETDDDACYTMERMPMTDIAIRWTHGAIDVEEFKKILDKTFYFFSIRESKSIDKNEYIKNADKLYLTKLDERVEKLKKLKQYKQIAMLIKSGTDFETIDEIIDKYKELYSKITSNFYKNAKFRTVIGHGDSFFANMLYSKETNLLRLIDPKGALEEKDLWTDPYYDIVKLSHSICGNYDFFNTASYDIILDKDMKFLLQIHFSNEVYKEIFKEYLENNGYDYRLVRLYESSLFLSMLPLHIDNPHKVFGFILNAINILKEVEESV